MLLVFLYLISFPLEVDNNLSELLSNGDFEAGNTGYASDYTHSPGNTQPEGTYDVVHDPQHSHPRGASFADHTSGTGLMLVANGAADTTRAVWGQSVAVTTHTTYTYIDELHIGQHPVQ